MKTNLFKNTFMSVTGVIISLLLLSFILEGEISAENKLSILQNQAKANPQISSLIMKRISKMQSLGITMENMDQENISKLESMDVKIEIVNSKFNLIQAWVPFDKVEELASLSFVRKITPPSYGILRTGSVNSEGDMVMGSDDVRNMLGFDGTGTRVGVISDGVENIEDSQATGDLPDNIIIGNPGDGDEGTALLEIIHDIAPGAELAFSEGFGTKTKHI